MPQFPEPKNLLLARLPDSDFQQIASHLEVVTLEARDIVCQTGEPMQYAYFPTSCMLSSIVMLADGTAVEVATIGQEGMAGVGLLMRERICRYRMVQQVKGKSLRISADRFEELLDSSKALRELIQRYMFTLLLQTAQNVACNLHHRLLERMSRWLLQTSDRAGRNEFDITQEFLSEMLGVSRQTINLTARGLQLAGLIDYRRGHLMLRDRAGLEQMACECYENFNSTYERYMQTPIVKPV